MSSTIMTGVKAHDDACRVAQVAHQSATSSASLTQAQAKAADIIYFKAVIASALANGGLEAGVFRQALHDLNGSYS
jgi:hypothetical protein